MATTVELLNEILTNINGEVSSEERTETALLRQILASCGCDPNELPDNLKTTLLAKIAEAVGNGGSGGGGTGGGGGEENSVEKWISGEAVTDINLPNATAIRANLFQNDKILTSISMPKVKSIGDYAFQNCSNLALTSLPNNLETIGNRSFSGCVNAFTFFPSSLKSIGTRAFYYNAFTAITFKGTPTSIASDAFDGCGKLTTINVPWAEGAVTNAPWGATNATINYNYTGE